MVTLRQKRVFHKEIARQTFLELENTPGSTIASLSKKHGVNYQNLIDILKRYSGEHSYKERLLSIRKSVAKRCYEKLISDKRALLKTVANQEKMGRSTLSRLLKEYYPEFDVCRDSAYHKRLFE
jgi:lambda repressor-like predicted transcriptional regulator